MISTIFNLNTLKNEKVTAIMKNHSGNPKCEFKYKTV